MRARELQYQLAVLKAVNSLGGDNVVQALESLPEDPPEQSRHIRRLTAMKSNVEGACHIFMSGFDDAERVSNLAYTLHLSSGSLNGVVYALCYLGYTHLLAGSLAEANGKFEQRSELRWRVAAKIRSVAPCRARFADSSSTSATTHKPRSACSSAT